ncbi:DDE superfamily endonuclease, partial [Rhizoctonia solani AG-3 Rhs1AP]
MPQLSSSKLFFEWLVVYSHGSQYTWCETGAKQVAVVGKEEKRAYTLLIGVSNSGQLLPFQAIYQGSTAASLPHPSSSGYGHAIKLGTRIEFSMTKTYWSTLQTMEDYVTFILVPFMKRMISENNLPPDQRCIWQIDVWSVHRSAAFRNWISETYPWIILQYIPGGCTGIFQACDVALQRVAKAAMRQKALADVINETNALLSDGADPTTVVHDKSIKTLRDRSVSWMLEAHRALDNPQLIQKAFSLCAVPDTEFNLSYSSLTSHEARQAIQALRTSDPKFHAEITAGRPASLTEDDENNEEDGNNEGDEDAEEDSDEALSAAEVVQMVMTSADAIEVSERLACSINSETSDLDDDDSDYDPKSSPETVQGDQHITEELRDRRSKRSSRRDIDYSSVAWWNSIDLED